MPIEIQTVLKDIVFNLQAYIHWYDEFASEGYWTAQNNATKFYNRLAELVPEAVEYFRDARCDNLTN